MAVTFWTNAGALEVTGGCMVLVEVTVGRHFDFVQVSSVVVHRRPCSAHDLFALLAVGLLDVHT
jgi:hypothetical protein